MFTSHKQKMFNRSPCSLAIKRTCYQTMYYHKAFQVPAHWKLCVHQWKKQNSRNGDFSGSIPSWASSGVCSALQAAAASAFLSHISSGLYICKGQLTQLGSQIGPHAASRHCPTKLRSRRTTAWRPPRTPRRPASSNARSPERRSRSRTRCPSQKLPFRSSPHARGTGSPPTPLPSCLIRRRRAEPAANHPGRRWAGRPPLHLAERNRRRRRVAQR